MATILDKTITRDSGNIINTNTNYSELNTKASGLVNDIVSHVETQIQTTEAALQASENLVDAKIASLLSVGDTGYTKDVVDTNFANQINALAPYSGYTSVSNKLDNFVFQESTSFLNKVADKNRYVKFGDKVVDTGSENLNTNNWDATSGANIVVDVDGTVSFLTTTNGQGANHNITTIIGEDYYISFDYIKISQEAEVRVGESINSSESLITGTLPSSGFYEYIFTATATSTYVSFKENDSGNASSAIFKNITIQRAQTAQFQVPEVAEIITDGSNTTSVAVSQGDYVVDGSELVANGSNYIGDFDTQADVDDWSIYSGTPSLVGGTMKMTHSSGYVHAYKYISGLISGKEYIVKYDIKSATNYIGFRVTDYANGCISGNILASSFAISDNIVLKFVAPDSGYVSIGAISNNISGAEYTIDNISVKRVSDTFRAKQDAPVGTALTDTTYFEDRTSIGVTNQQLSYHAYNTLTNAYEGIKTEVLFTDVSKEDLLDNSVWLASNGFSKVSDFLYSKGSYLILPVGIWQSLNKGAYHPVLNPFGCSAFTTTSATPSLWYNTDTSLDNASDCFNDYNIIALRQGYGWKRLSDNDPLYISIGSVSRGASGASYNRPDSKFYDIVYEDQFTDVREYAKILNKDEVAMIVADKEDNGVEEAVSMIQYQANGSGSGNGTYWVSNLGTAPDINNTLIEGETFIFTVVSTDDPFISAGTYQYPLSYNATLDAYYINTGGGVLTSSYNTVILTTTTKPILSSNTKLSIDLIGDPDNYPQIMKDRLASGVGIVGINPSLIKPDGTSNIPTNTLVSNTFYYSSKATKWLTELYAYADNNVGNGTHWNTYTINRLNSITNSISISDDRYGLRILPYTSKNQPYIQTTPKPVIDVEPKTIASNSHSIYKGALIGNQVAGKIQVGNGSNGYESKVLENVIEVYYDESLPTSGVITVKPGKLYLYNGGAANGTIGYVYESVSKNAVSTVSVFGFDSDSGFRKLGVPNIGFPTNSTIALDNANSPASKWFNTLSQGDNGVVGSVYGEELAYNSVTSSYDGDDDEFEQLTNGTVTDLNGNTTRTFVGHIAINGEVK